RHAGEASKIRPQMLKTNDNKREETNTVWHRQYKCSGIKICQNTSPLLFGGYEVFNRVDTELFTHVSLNMLQALPLLSCCGRVFRVTACRIAIFNSLWTNVTCISVSLLFSIGKYRHYSRPQFIVPL